MSIGGAIYQKIKLEEGETVIKQSRANLQTGFIIPRGGKLILTTKRLIFLDDKFSSLILEKAPFIIISLAAIRAVERKKGDMRNLLAGSFRSRLHILCNENECLFQVWDVDKWLERIREAMENK